MGSIEAYAGTFDLEPGYLDWAAFGPLSPTVREENIADLELLATGRRSSIDNVVEHAATARSLVAELVGGSEEGVTLQPGTTQGLMQAIFGVTGGLLLSRAEYPSLTVAATRAAEALHVVEPQWMDPPAGYVTPEVVRDTISASTRAVALSLVDFRTGYRADLAGIREVIGDRLLIVDAVQGFGMVDADYQAADVVCGNGYKWLRAGRGTGFAWFSERALTELTPVFSGPTGTDVPLPIDGVPPASAAANAFTVSVSDHIAAARLSAALREIVNAGVADIEEALAMRTREVLFLSERYGIPSLTPREAVHRAGIVALVPPAQDVAALAASLANHGVTCTTRSGAVRIAAHVGTAADSFVMLGDALAEFAQARNW
ncbi:MAG TPA: aminotransferase [Microbacterium sp.]|nr:aminotransferase [Microbacterium sp.]